MQEPIESYCHVGLIHPMAFPEVAAGEGPITETLEQIVLDPFFSAVEVTRMKDPAVLREAAQMLAVSGMDVIFSTVAPLLQEKLSLCDLKKTGRQKAIDLCKSLMDQAYQLGASIFVVASGPDPGEADRPKATAAFVDSLKQLCAEAQQRAETHMLSVSVENFDRTIDKRFLIGPTAEAAEVAKAVYEEYSNSGLTIDLSHQPLLRESVQDMVLAAIDHLLHVHIGNCVMDDPSHPAYGDRHPRFACPGGQVGVEELKRFLETLIYAGYFKKNTPTGMPVMSFEVQPMAGEKPAWVIVNSKRALRDAWARL
jgi:sugar phosphate isomerase/epimerase